MKNKYAWVKEILNDNPDFTIEQIRGATHNRLSIEDVQGILDTIMTDEKDIEEIPDTEADNEEDKQDGTED